MKLRYLLWGFILLSGFSVTALAELKLQQVTKNVYAIVGPMVQRSDKNMGNNATFGFVITQKGVVLIDSGGGFQAAQKIDALIKTVTKLPIKYVINTGGQDHRWFGNGYFKKKGAMIIASRKAVEDQKHRADAQYNFMATLVGDKVIKGTESVYADKVFVKEYDLDFGGVVFKIKFAGAAHTAGDSYVWLPQKKTVFTGDIVYVERILTISDHSNVKSWIKVFEEIAKLKPVYVVPGHGGVTSLEKATRDTYDYLKFVRKGMMGLHEKGLTEESVSTLDQSKYKYLKNYEKLKGKNALKVFMQLEFE